MTNKISKRKKAFPHNYALKYRDVRFLTFDKRIATCFDSFNTPSHVS